MAPAPRPLAVRFDGRDERGASLARGVYRIVLRQSGGSAMVLRTYVR